MGNISSWVRRPKMYLLTIEDSRDRDKVLRVLRSTIQKYRWVRGRRKDQALRFLFEGTPDDRALIAAWLADHGVDHTIEPAKEGEDVTWLR
jgi:hypothetical protein